MRPRHTEIVALLLACTVPVAACNDDEGRTRVIGLIDTTAAAQALVAPDTAPANTPIQVTVTTWGSPCRTADGATARVAGSVADITAYDRLAPPGTTCIESILPLPRQVTVAYPTPGQALIRFHGRFGEGMVTVEHPMTVVP